MSNLTSPPFIISNLSGPWWEASRFWYVFDPEPVYLWVRKAVVKLKHIDKRLMVKAV